MLTDTGCWVIGSKSKPLNATEETPFWYFSKVVTTLSGGETASDFPLYVPIEFRLLHPFRVDSFSR